MIYRAIQKSDQELLDAQTHRRSQETPITEVPHWTPHEHVVLERAAHYEPLSATTLCSPLVWLPLNRLPLLAASV